MSAEEETDQGQEGHEWDAVVREWLIDSGYCSAGGIASASDGALYAAAAEEGVDAWAALYKEDYEMDVVGEEGETTVTINEPETIRCAVEDGKAPYGMWLGGEKYRIVLQEQQYEHHDCKFDITFCAKSKGGCHIIKTENGSLIFALHDEEKEQTAGMAKGCALAFAEFMVQQGY